MMTTLIIVIVIVATLGSIFWVLPSPHERKRMRFRQAAISQGMSVQFVKPDIPPALTNKVASQAYCIGYRLTFHDSNPLTSIRFYRSEAEATDWWQDSRGSQQTVAEEHLMATLNALPDDVRAVMVGGPCVTAVWQERGEEADIEQIKRQLVSLTDQLMVVG
ncbi:hypothetical protein H0A36_18835 [Endozoicomonas sp. SM1973]|uniref:Preprotein translocase subunit YajC n=1 Tax=Spartinivicinus marinus TaxID=2994442 RepID=A0A853IG11_9GAMM|nr:hypothetical protein [Spartinivicinus marinus]MCX4029744.1 hypothetical protein [Spartinivicinus marinus]NYZ68075.1 hypothetical protein [Spartinivicinus marinus]